MDVSDGLVEQQCGSSSESTEPDIPPVGGPPVGVPRPTPLPPRIRPSPAGTDHAVNDDMSSEGTLYQDSNGSSFAPQSPCPSPSPISSGEVDQYLAPMAEDEDRAREEEVEERVREEEAFQRSPPRQESEEGETRDYQDRLSQAQEEVREVKQAMAQARGDLSKAADADPGWLAEAIADPRLVLEKVGTVDNPSDPHSKGVCHEVLERSQESDKGKARDYQDRLSEAQEEVRKAKQAMEQELEDEDTWKKIVAFRSTILARAERRATLAGGFNAWNMAIALQAETELRKTEQGERRREVQRQKRQEEPVESYPGILPPGHQKQLIQAGQLFLPWGLVLDEATFRVADYLEVGLCGGLIVKGRVEGTA